MPVEIDPSIQPIVQQVTRELSLPVTSFLVSLILKIHTEHPGLDLALAAKEAKAWATTHKKPITESWFQGDLNRKIKFHVVDSQKRAANDTTFRQRTETHGISGLPLGSTINTGPQKKPLTLAQQRIMADLIAKKITRQEYDERMKHENERTATTA